MSLERIPQARRPDVEAALAAVFGTRRVDDVRPLIGGASGALILRIEVAGRVRVLRLEPLRITLTDRARGYACMGAAAAVGAAPAVHFADPETGVAIMDFVEARPVAEHSGGAAGVAHDLGGLAARIRETPAFPGPVDYPRLIETQLGKSAKLFTPGLLEPHLACLAQVRARLPWEMAAQVSAHNDPNPRNLLFDGARFWLVDWELGWRNDPLVDVAILGTDFARTPALEDVLLAAAFGRAPDRAMRARLRVMRQLTHLFYGGIILGGFVEERAEPDVSLAAPTEAEFRAMLADGRLSSGTPQVAYVAAKMHLAAVIAEAGTAGFAEAMEIVAGG